MAADGSRPYTALSKEPDAPTQTAKDAEAKDAQAKLDGQAQIEEKRHRTRLIYITLLFVYLGFGILSYWIMEGWEPLHSLVFTLSILTGVGYGHLVPSTPASQIFTAIYIFLGLVIFATIAGQILELVMEGEISAVAEALHSYKTGGEQEAATAHQVRRRKKRMQLFVGLANIVLVYGFAVVLFMAWFGEKFAPSVYLAAVSVLKLDSICLLDGVHCSSGWQSSTASGHVGDIIFAIIWYMVTYGIIGHFLVSASNYFGADPENTMTKISTLNAERVDRMDVNNDGFVSRSEFLRDRLIRAEIVGARQIDEILKNFDDLDKDGTGRLDKTDFQ